MATDPVTPADIAVFVLAGGASTRMGADKARLVVDGAPMVERVVRAAEHLGTTWIVGGDPDLATGPNENGSPTARHLHDAHPGAGPFSALVSALGVTAAPEALVLACDLARPRAADFDLLIAARRSTDADIAVPLVGGRRQWHALAVATRVLPMLREAEAVGVRSLQQGFRHCSEVVVCAGREEFFSDVDEPGRLDELRSSFG